MAYGKKLTSNFRGPKSKNQINFEKSKVFDTNKTHNSGKT
jgi:hypothetical protein